MKKHKEEIINSIENLLKEIESKISEREFSVRFNLKNVIKSLLWSVILEYGKSGNDIYNYEKNKIALELDLEAIVDEVFRTTYFIKGPEWETYPSFNQAKRFKDAYERISKVLKIKGIASQKMG